MSQLAKLYRKFLDGRPLSFAEFERLLEAFGYRYAGTTGSHRAYRHPRIGDKRIIQPEGKDAKTYQIKQFRDIVEAHGLSLED